MSIRSIQSLVRPVARTPSLLPLASTSSPRSFTSSAVNNESKAKRKTRLVRKANLAKKESLVRQHEAARPDPVLGFAKGNEDLWEKSLLKSILLDREAVWGQPSTTPGAAAGEGSGYTPKLFNFGLTAQEAEQLSDALPATAALRSTLGDQATSVDAVMLSRFEEATEAEQRKRDTLMRIVDLRNADSKGIEVENTRRIIATFGRTPGDTASPEVQCAFPYFFSFSFSSLLTFSLP